MNRGTLQAKAWLAIIVFSTISALGALRARADALVNVSLNGLDPSTVTIFAGDAVYWTDADGNGPYGIYGDAGWSTVTDGNGVLFSQTGSYGYYDDNGDQGTINVIAYVPPTVAITAPANNAVFSAPATFDFSANASSPIGISDIEFDVGTNFWDDVFSEPFITTVTNLPAGTYKLTAIASDNDFDTASASITITVGSAPPTLFAGQAGNQMVISWNTNNAVGLSLQSTTNFMVAGSWKPAGPPVQVGGQWVVTVPMIGPRQFFRLSNH